ncbi:mfs monosaccharide transporter [Moniliophthora roreri MCA 2997]|uniref:Mfs monosaccharide transporter n=2 Tax=Moniliophthora roreri TaxID=221103 RepID=V2YHB9_MONRO|nr:mfs monosaccharide transporter [Moniliophthora roreri MCA 2997]
MGNPNAAATGAIVATYIAGEAVGAIMQMFVGDKLGRKRFMQLMCIVVTTGTVIQTAAQNYAMFLVGRILTGVAVGGLIGTVPIYNSEISPPTSRGFIGGLSGYMIGFGTCAANWIGYLCGYANPETSGSFQWRFPLALQIPPGVILFFGLQFVLPDSPRWLIRHGYDDRARLAYAQINGQAENQEFNDMREQILYEKDSEVNSVREAWAKYRKRVAVAVFVQTMTSLTGVNVINYYQTILYGGLGINGQNNLLLAAVYGTVGFMANTISIRLLDRFGRVKMLLWGTSLLVVDLVYCAVTSRYFGGGGNKVGAGFTVLGIYLFTIIYYLSINSTTWLYGVEVLPMSLRSKITGLAATSHFVINIGVTQAGPSAFANIHENYYYVFVVTTTIYFLGVLFFFPETKGKTLEMIAAEFGDKVVVAGGQVVANARDSEAGSDDRDHKLTREEEHLEHL